MYGVAMFLSAVCMDCHLAGTAGEKSLACTTHSTYLTPCQAPPRLAPLPIGWLLQKESGHVATSCPCITKQTKRVACWVDQCLTVANDFVKAQILEGENGSFCFVWKKLSISTAGRISDGDGGEATALV